MNTTATDRDLSKLAGAGIFCENSVRLVGKSTFERPVRLMEHVRLIDCQMGAYSYVAPGTQLVSTTVGRYCSIADGCLVGPAQHPTDWLSSSPLPYQDIFNLGSPLDLPMTPSQHIEIGNDVWIGARVSIMGGVRIGHGAIIALGSVVTKDVPPYAIVGGVPARLIKYRLPETTIARLLVFQWWRFDLLAARQAGIGLSWQDPERALDELEAAEKAGRLPALPGRAVAVNGGGG
jgi:hypothetical protein